jgi:hypothetical protein
MRATAGCWAAIRPLPISARTKKRDDGVDIVIQTVRHNPDPNYRAMAGTDDATLLAKGRADGDLYRFEGGLKELPGVAFHSVMTPIEQDAVPIAGGVGEGGIVNGLYSIHIRMLDGVEGGLTGVMLLNDGRILGGDASFYYLGTYTSEKGRWKGQILNQEHTPAMGRTPSSAAMKSASAFPAPATRRARCWRRPRSPASAAFA